MSYILEGVGVRQKQGKLKLGHLKGDCVDFGGKEEGEGKNTKKARSPPKISFGEEIRGCFGLGGTFENASWFVRARRHFSGLLFLIRKLIEDQLSDHR